MEAWRDKSEHVPRAAEPDVPVSYDSPGVARPGEGRLRVIGEAEVPAIPNVPALPDDSQPMARLRDCLGMHERAYPPRVMRALRELIEKRPKNVSFSEDNGYWMPTGSRLEFKICPRDSAVPTDWRHRWSRKWTWSVWPVGNVPGTWVWMADEEGVAPSDIHFWPSTERPILAAVYLCPTETYKDAQHASTDHVQSGRQHSSEPMSTCQTCITESPPREKSKREQTEQKCLTHSTQPPPRELTSSMRLLSCPTRFMIEQQSRESAHRVVPRYPSGSEPSTEHFTTSEQAEQLAVRGTRDGGWAKQATQGLNLPGSCIDRKNGQRDPIRLCTQNGGWVWNVHCVPPLRVAKRSTPHEALRNWQTKHENAIQPASVEAARQLAKEWEAFPVPQPTRKTRSFPPQVVKTMQSETILGKQSSPGDPPEPFTA